LNDIDPTPYGTNLAAGKRPIAGMQREQREAHARLAALPRRVHLRGARQEPESAAAVSNRSDIGTAG
jgi:hypothetical protein